MRDYMVPPSKAEDRRDNLLWISVFWPMLAAYVGMFYLFWADKFNRSVDLLSIMGSIGVAILGMVPVVFFWFIFIVYPEVKDCHSEYNDWHFYWSHIFGINFFPLAGLCGFIGYKIFC